MFVFVLVVGGSSRFVVVTVVVVVGGSSRFVVITVVVVGDGIVVGSTVVVSVKARNKSYFFIHPNLPVTVNLIKTI